MAQRFFQQFSFGLEKMPVRLNAEIAATATQTGNAAQTINRGKGFTSVKAAATGVWTIVLDDVYFKLLGFSVSFKSPDGTTAPANTGAWLKSEAVATSGTQNIVLQLVGGVNAAAATAPNNGDVMFIELLLSNSGAL